jgi:hypothetical protein
MTGKQCDRPIASTGYLSATRAGSTLLLALMPKFGCPLCWPVLAVSLGAVGLPIRALNALFIGIAALSFVVACIQWLRTPAQRVQWTLLATLSMGVLIYRFIGLERPAFLIFGALGILCMAILQKERAALRQRRM